MNARELTISRNTLAWLLAAFTSIASIACADDETPVPTDGTLDKCSGGVLESDRGTDLALAGPGIDPHTGQLAPGNYLVATTYLALKADKAARARELAGPVVQSLFGMQGFVAFSTSASSGCAAMRTLTVWKSEEDMLALVTSPAHRAAMAEASELSRGSSGTIAWEGSEKDATWERAAAQLAAQTGADH